MRRGLRAQPVSLLSAVRALAALAAVSLFCPGCGGCGAPATGTAPQNGPGPSVSTPPTPAPSGARPPTEGNAPAANAPSRGNVGVRSGHIAPPGPRLPAPNAAPEPVSIRLEVTQVRSIKTAQTVVERLLRLKGVRRATANHLSGITVVRYDPRRCTAADVVAHLKKAGFSARVVK